MADYEDTKVKDLIINNMSQEKFNELKDAGELDPTQLYCTPEEGGAELPDQTGNTGKFLRTNGTDVSWSEALTNNTSVNYGLAIGRLADVTTLGAQYGGLAIGYGAQTYKGSMLLNSSGYLKSNNDVGTFKVCITNDIYTLIDADGTIPTDRYTITPTVAGTYVPKLTIAEDGTATREWGTESGGAGGDYLPLSGGELTGAITFNLSGDQAYNFTPVIVSPNGDKVMGIQTNADGVTTTSVVWFKDMVISDALLVGKIGYAYSPIPMVYTKKIGSGTDDGLLTVPDGTGTLARIEDINNIVEVLPTADNGYTTVKNFGNGYVEITGYASIGTVGAGTGSEVQIDLPAGYTMANANYWVNIAPTSETTMFDFKAEAKARSTTHFMVAYKNEDTVTGLTAAGVFWEVRGMLATTEA